MYTAIKFTYNHGLLLIFKGITANLVGKSAIYNMTFKCIHLYLLLYHNYKELI